MADVDNGAFAPGIELLRMSPSGLVRMAADWLEASRGDYGFDARHVGFKAAGDALMSAPDIFVGDSQNSWGESGRPAFWRRFFQARAQGKPVADLALALTQVDKATLVMGAKDMLILAARAGDAASFGELLDLGAARRSKLVMFSAYQNGGKDVALMVKAPTQMEAKEMIANGALGYRGSRDMRHDADGFAWLMDIAGCELTAANLAKIGARAPDADMLAMAVEKYIDRIGFAATRQYVQAVGNSVDRSETDMLHAGILSMASAGSPKAAKAMALAKGGPDLWLRACSQGFEGLMTLTIRGATTEGESSDVSFGARDPKLAASALAKTTVQAACALSRSVEACAWLRAEQESIGAPWQPAEELAKIYAPAKARAGRFDPDLFEKAVSISELADLRFGAGPLTMEPSAGRKKSL